MFDYTSTPKEFAFISFFIKKIYGETPIPRGQALSELANLSSIPFSRKTIFEPKKDISFPKRDKISQALEIAFASAMGNNCLCNLIKLQKSFKDSLPEVTVKIIDDKIAFYDTMGKKRDCFNIPRFISLE